MEEILVIAEHRQGKFREITYEQLGFARQIGTLKNLSVTTVVLGMTAAGAGALQCACDCVLYSDDARFADYNAPDYLLALTSMIRSRRPRLIVVGHTAQGMDLAPVLAVRTGLPLVTDCLGFEWTEAQVFVRRQLYAGKIDARLTLNPAEAYMISLRPGTFEGLSDAGKRAVLEAFPVPVEDGTPARRFVQYIAAETEDVDITDAEILVSIGRGVGKPENIPLVEAFAGAIGGTLSCSRPVADNRWLPKTRQVGTSGKTVRPKIYIALGISGAFQHQAGMKHADTIIAVNTDPEAPIFSVAHYGIVGDLLEVLPVLTKKFTSA